VTEYLPTDALRDLWSFRRSDVVPLDSFRPKWLTTLHTSAGEIQSWSPVQGVWDRHCKRSAIISSSSRIIFSLVSVFTDPRYWPSRPPDIQRHTRRGGQGELKRLHSAWLLCDLAESHSSEKQ
jgi:hypothetical protein